MKLANASEIRSAIQETIPAGTERDTLLNAVEDAEQRLPDNWVYRIVVLSLGVAIFIPLFALPNRETMQLLLPISTAALGALAGLLSPAPSQQG